MVINSFKFLIPLFFLSLTVNSHIKKVRLYHDSNKENIWIKCSVNENDYLDGKALVYDKKGSIIYLGYFSDGYHRDSSILQLENNTKVKYYFQDSLTYEKLIYYDNRLRSKSFYENNTGKWSITYDIETGNVIGDTLTISGGGMGSYIRNNSLSRLKKIKTEVD